MEPETHSPQPQPQDQKGFYKPAAQSIYDQAPEVAPAAAPGVEWEASEYIYRSKSVMWLAGLIAITVIALAIAIFIFKAWSFALLIIIMAVGMGVFAFRQPRTIHYQLTNETLTIDNKAYPLQAFRAYGIMPEGAFYNGILIPTKRFMPAVNVYFSAAEGERIVAILGQHMPAQEFKPDLMDKFLHHLHF